MLRLDFEVKDKRYQHDFTACATCYGVELYDNNGYVDISDIVSMNLKSVRSTWHYWSYGYNLYGVTHWTSNGYDIYSLAGEDDEVARRFEHFFLRTSQGEHVYKHLGPCVALKSREYLTFIFKDYTIRCSTGELPEVFYENFMNFFSAWMESKIV